MNEAIHIWGFIERFSPETRLFHLYGNPSTASTPHSRIDHQCNRCRSLFVWVSYGTCPVELFDTVKESGFLPIIIDLVMEDYIPRSELNEEEWEEQRKAIIELQNEFLHILEENDLKIEAIKKGSRPWLAMHVDE